MHNIRKFVNGAALLITLTLLALPSLNGYAEQKVKKHEKDTVVPDQAIVRIDAAQSIHGAIAGMNAAVLREIPGKNLYLVNVPGHRNFAELQKNLEKKKGVISVRPNRLVELPEVNQVDEQFPDQSNPIYLEGTSPGAYYQQQQSGNVGSDSANILTSGRGAVIGVIDNGVEYYHPVFIYVDSTTSDTTLDTTFADMGYDFVDDDYDASEETGDSYGHGTFVTGIIKLVAPDCKIIPYRTFNGDGFGNSFDITAAIYRAINDGVDVINMSFGLYSSDTSIAEAVNSARNAGVVMVASSGNGNSGIPFYPAAYNGVIAVSALDSNDYLADFSNHGSYVDFCALGVDVYSSLAGEYKWGTWSGTSFSAPQITGLCALIIELRPSYTTSQVDSLLVKSADTTLAWGSFTPHSTSYGYGKGNAYETALCLRRGDVNNSGDIDSLDVAYLNNYLNNSGPSPIPIFKLGDVNCSGTVNMLDVSYLLNYLNNNGVPPCCGE